MKTAHYLAAFLACTAVTLGGISLLHAQGDAPAATGTTPAAEAPAAEAKPVPMPEGFKTLDERLSYAVAFEQAEQVKVNPAVKVDSDAFIKGYKAAVAGEDASYTMGFTMGTGFKTNREQAKNSGINFDAELFAAGLSAGLKNEKGRMTKEQREAAFKEIEAEMQKKQMAAMAKAQAEAAAQADKAKAAGKAFLDANAKKEGWQTTKSGLQYRVVAAGAGAHPKPTDIVRAHYAGRLIDGTEFDSSYKRNEPADFPLNRVIPGWTEGLQLIGKGGKLELAIPSELGYGEQGSPPRIPGGSVLLFTVELVDVNPPAKAGADR